MKSNETETKLFHHEKGTTFFSKQTERRILFIMTLIMLSWGIIEGIGEHF